MATSRTVNDLIKDVLLLLNVVNPSETPTAADVQQVLYTIQDMLAEWSGDGLLVPIVTVEYFSTVVGQEAYTVGENGAPSKNTPRPEQVLGAYVNDGTSDYDVQIIGQREYRLLTDKEESGRPDTLWVNYTTPNCTFYLYPSPDAIYSFYFVSHKPLTEPTSTLTASLLDTVLLPRNYYNAIKHNAACEVGPYFEKQPSEWMIRRALVTKRQLKALNLSRTLEPVRLEITGGGNTGNILSY